MSFSEKLVDFLVSIQVLTKEPEKDKKTQEYPERRRIEDLKKSRNSARFLIIAGVLLVGFSIFYGQVGNGMFVISFEFIIGLIFIIIGALMRYNSDEKIKDLEMQLAK